jgi:hypothetical protein
MLQRQILLLKTACFGSGALALLMDAKPSGLGRA